MRRILVYIMLTMLMFPQVAIGAPKSTASGKEGNRPEITNVRFFVHNDTVGGASKLRLVLEVTSPVAVEASLNSFPSPHLVVDIKGASLGKIKNSLALDGKIAERASFSNQGPGDSRIEIDLPLMIGDDDYKVFKLPSDPKANKPNRIVIDINKVAVPINYEFTAGLKDKIIAIDPGHGGSDSGAIGLNGLQEKTVTLAIAQKVQALLTKAGAKVIMTRHDDRDVYAPNATAVDELKARSSIANSNRADVFVSIHINAFQNRSVGGIATYYYQKSGFDAMLARNIQENLYSKAGLSNRGISTAGFYVIKNTVMPGVLLELGFISNPNEEQLLGTSQFQLQLAQGIVDGLDDFFAQASKMGGGQ